MAGLLPKDATPLFLGGIGSGHTESIRWLQRQAFSYVVRLRADTLVYYRGQTIPLD